MQYDDTPGGTTPAGTAVSRFDPTKYLTRVNGKEYLEVKHRLLWLRSEHPEAVLDTALVEHGNRAAVFRARVSLPSGASATGWGSEGAEDFHDYLEKAETKAVGRALAALGYGTQFATDFEAAPIVAAPRPEPQPQPEQRASGNGITPGQPVLADPAREHDFHERHQRDLNQRDYATRPATTVRQERQAAPPTDRQMKYLDMVGREMGYTRGQVEQFAREEFRQELDEMDRRTVSGLIEKIKSAPQLA